MADKKTMDDHIDRISLKYLFTCSVLAKSSYFVLVGNPSFLVVASAPGESTL